ncbi:calcium uniporter protein 2, mitochondrial-like [Rutidosis leptorrhynchoides]|uniref:calcium uniporter protein 2, mitochondrial-like n=1 Tax=Rutidosis leptorrhynchoides TaxID=125765 RepID=UPI003A99AFFC
MAFKQTLIHRMFNICTTNKLSNQTLRNCRISSSSTATAQFPIHRNPVAPDPGDESILRRFLVPEILRSRNESMLEKLKEIDITRNRIRLDGLSPQPTAGELTVAHAKKILRVSQIEKLKLKLKSSCKNHISYDEFVEICVNECYNRDQGLELAKALDDSGSVIVLGNVVFLKPEQVVKAIHGLLPTSLPATHNPPIKELEEMERWKSEIDTKAKKLVQRELWGGLAYLMVQTAGFMRLTFWELSWDVMEPICFYVTSIYFMAGYAFFLRTAKEPSFEGFFQSRFNSKQKKLMKREGFDVGKYIELRKACYPHEEAWPSENALVDGGVKKSFN